jgi:hypothetical protein
VERKRVRRGPILIDAQKRVVREKEVRLFRPSVFEGRTVSGLPPAGKTWAWAVDWPETTVVQDPEAPDQPMGTLAYHQPLLVHSAATLVRGESWHALEGPGAGHVRGGSIRRWVEGPSLAAMRDQELWIDVDLDQQVLAVMRGSRPEFVTLISSGSIHDPTPRGLFRIRSKQAFGDMRSSPEDLKSYLVEAVPWAQYFHRRYGLHGTYWHNRFGRRTSHGCINLSPRDAARVYGLTTPTVPAGWLSSYEHPGEPGTLVRIRQRDQEVPDRRIPLE